MRAERIHLLNDAPVKQGKYILYWMQGNLALCRAAQSANETELPLLILFCLNANYPEANYWHFKFMIDGLLECADTAGRLGIGFELSDQSEDQIFQLYFRQAAAIICDQGYLRLQREGKERLAKEVSCRIETVEDNLIVPIASASWKAEWSARTIRTKLMKKLLYFTEDILIRLQELKHPYANPENQNREIAERFFAAIRQHQYLTAIDTIGRTSRVGS